ncbi:acyltransferase [Bradyrhizobium sp. 1]|uniref:acyltransferase family protein n=1 Tax=Bradyrhizobium sp. 1 TaxID=241591 RepID=UPI001FF95978|nr:acyltransferase [Bradyrhizobium sp. 1]MCK1396146.1 acyltransferase [Bradyrhizobium sp. 1]
MIRNLQALRAVAAYMVVIYHFLGQQVSQLYPETRMLSFGAAGVDIFFVISGFIMVVTTMKRESTPSDFLSHRIARIGPVYWVVTLLLFSMTLYGFKPVGIMRMEPDWLAKSLLFIPFDRDGRVEPIISVGWTLNYEMFFYVLFAASLFVRQALTRTLLLCAVMAALVIVPFFVETGLLGTFYTTPIILEFAFGCALGYAFTRAPSAKLGSPVPFYAAIALGGLIIILAQIFHQGPEPELTGFTRPFVWGAAGLLIVAGAVFLERMGRVVPYDWLVELGNASYSIYLIHALLLHAASKTAKMLFPLGFASLGFNLVIAVIGSAVVGLLLYRTVELPANLWLRTRLRPLRTA